MQKLFVKLCVAVALVGVGVVWVGEIASAQPPGVEVPVHSPQSAPVSDFGPRLTSTGGSHAFDVALTVTVAVAILGGLIAGAVYTLHVKPKREAAETGPAEIPES